MTPAALIALGFAALAAAALSAMIGMGGGSLLLGVMALLLPAALVVPVHGVAQGASNGARALVFLRHVRWGLVLRFAPPLVLGVVAATLVWRGDQLTWFRPVIGVFLLGFVVWRRHAPRHRMRNPPLWVYSVAGLCAGFLSIFVGATGPFIAPFFLRDDLDKEAVIATKAACQTVGHLLKIPAFVALGFDYVANLPLLTALVAAVVVGTLLGKRWLARITQTRFVTLFEAALVVMGVLLIVRAFV